MTWFSPKKARPTLDGLFDAFAATLERDPSGLKTLHHIDELPADKRLIKAVLLQKAYELGEAADEILKAGFVLLADFQDDTSEPASRHFEIAAEMAALSSEWRARVQYSSEAHA